MSVVTAWEKSVAVNSQNNRKQILIGVVDSEARKIFSLCLGRRSCETNVSDTTIGGGLDVEGDNKT